MIRIINCVQNNGRLAIEEDANKALKIKDQENDGPKRRGGKCTYMHGLPFFPVLRFGQSFSGPVLQIQRPDR